MLAAVLLAQVGFPTKTPTRPPRPTPTRSPVWATPTPTPAFIPTSTPTRPPGPTATPTPAPPTQHISLQVGGCFSLTDIKLNGVQPEYATWQRNKAMPVRIYPGKAGVWVDAAGKTAAATANDNVVVCAGAACASFFVQSPILR